MFSRRQLLASGALAGALTAAGLPSDALAGSAPWNVLVLCSDEHNPRFFSHLGHPVQTPNLDRLAAEGLSLDRAYTASPVCAPTRGSFLSGLWPQQHGQTNNHLPFDPGHYTLAEFFTEQGYDTACFGKLHTNADEENETFGFGELLTAKSGRRWKEALRRRNHEGGRAGDAVYDAGDSELFTGSLKKMLGRVQPRLGQNRDYVLLQEAKAWLARGRQQPFFLMTSFMAPHYPFTLPEHWYHLHDPARVELPPSVDVGALRARSPAAAASLDRYGWDRLAPEQLGAVMARYMGCVSYLDWLVGEMLDHLAALGLARNTLVLYLSDHGDQAGEQGLWLKLVMFDGAARKPAILRMPGRLEAGSRSRTAVNEVDMLPTVAGLVGLDEALPTELLAGRSRHRELLSGATGSAPAFCHMGFGEGRKRPRTSLVAGERFKLVRTTQVGGKVLARELYDLDEDPGELVNLAAEPEAGLLVEEMERELELHLKGLQTTISAT